MATEHELRQFMLKQAYKPLTLNELLETFAIAEEDQEAFVQLVDELEADGKIVKTRSARYGVPERMNLLRGTLQGNAKGFGFVLPDDSSLPDLYVHISDLNGAMDRDVVLARVHKHKYHQRHQEGEIIRVLKRGRESIVGTFAAFSSHFGVVIPDDKRLTTDVFIPPEAWQGVKDGQKVVVQITHYPTGRHSAEGKITEILGHGDDPGVDIVSIIRKHGLPESFSEEVLQEAESVPEKIDESEIEGRRDLRERTMVTIDGSDAKDLDDAVSIERLDNGNIRLGVHIADVSYYVREGSALDREAFERGCSVYLVDRVIPMLPKRLSNGICSLNPHVDRLTLTCDMEFDATGKVVDYEIYPSVIRTNERMTYDDVQKIVVDEDQAVMKKYDALVGDFQLMAELAKKLREKRMKRGAIDFNFTEAKVVVDDAGKPTEIKLRPRILAEQLIEEFMLAANETVAEHFCRLETPFVYRIHESPDAERLKSFFEFVTSFGYTVKGRPDKVKPRTLQTLLSKTTGKPEETIISTVMLRSMKQAKYAAESIGHFGLAATFYTHFTSPIRRYPDLLIHRIIHEVISKGSLKPERIDELNEWLPEATKQSSIKERVAVDAERETQDLKKAEYMVDKVGEEYAGRISSVTSFGVFVELENTIEGMIHVSYLTDDYYHYDDHSYSLIGERTGQIFRIGDQVRIRVSKVNLDERKIDFELLEHLTEREKAPAKKTKRSKPSKVRKAKKKEKTKEKTAKEKTQPEKSQKRAEGKPKRRRKRGRKRVVKKN